MTCESCVFWKADWGTWTVTGWTGNGSNGHCYVEPQRTAKRADGIACRHHRERN